MNAASLKNSLLLSLLLTLLLALMYQWPALLGAEGNVNWWPILGGFVLSVLLSMTLNKLQGSESGEAQQEVALGAISPDHLEALYKQVMIVERNAHKANTVFTQQLGYIQKLLEKSKALKGDANFDQTHEQLVHELAVLEKHMARMITEMNKNIKLGERLQQSVANIDPEIGVL